ncbi:MAG: hypothetical protein V4501_06945 [Pseudomonadota bacterium]
MAIPIKEEGLRTSRLNRNHRVKLWAEYLIIDHDGPYEKLYVKFYPQSAEFAAGVLFMNIKDRKQPNKFYSYYDSKLKTYIFSHDTRDALKFLLGIPDCISKKTHDEAIAALPAALLYNNNFPSVNYGFLRRN